MTGLAVFLLVVCVVLAIALTCVCIVALRYARMLMQLEDRFDEALETLDTSYREIGAVLQRPVFYDSPEIRRVIRSLRRSQQAVLLVANKITRVTDDDDEDLDE